MTEQENQPHKSLVQVRNSIECALGCSRKEAAQIANGLTAKQCDAVVSADGDDAKVKAAIKPESKPEVKPESKPKEADAVVSADGDDAKVKTKTKK